MKDYNRIRMGGSTRRRVIGNLGEDIACKFLKKRGYTIIERNYLRPWGEVDIVARKGDIIRFVEVKSISRERSSDVARERFRLTPEDHMHPQKLKRLVRTVELYMAERGEDYQIDMVAVVLNMRNRTAQCTLYEQIL